MPFVTAPLVSHRGGRHTNQDNGGWREASGSTVWVVADGLGGHASGEIASEGGVEGALAAFDAAPGTDAGALSRTVESAQAVIRTLIDGSPELDSMRTTIVVLAADAAEARWAHVGDSRLYLFREGRIAARTTDHSVPQMLVEAGEITPDEVRHHPDRNRLTRALGGDKTPKPVVSDAYTVHPGDAYLLCTDGFWELVEDHEMEADLSAADTPEAWLSAMEARLTSRASGRHDNYTALAIWATA